MEVNDDPRLRSVLREWQVPNAPPTIEQRLFLRTRPWWQVLIAGRIRIPAPLALTAGLAIVFLTSVVILDRLPSKKPSERVVTLQGFQPVNYVSVRIERSGNAGQ
jgi:hypothetical protein